MASPAPEGERHKRAKEIATEVRAGFPTATATASVIGTGLWGGGTWEGKGGEALHLGSRLT